MAKKRTQKVGNKRTAAQIASDRALIWQLYHSNFTQKEIAQRINERADGKYKITQQQVSVDLKAARQNAVEQLEQPKEVFIIQQLARIDRLEAECWSEWDRSKGQQMEAYEISTKGTSPVRINGTVSVVNVDKKETRKRVNTRAAEAKYLETIRWCIAERSKILALYNIEPAAPDIADHAVGKIIESEGGVVVYLPDNNRNDYHGERKQLPEG